MYYCEKIWEVTTLNELQDLFITSITNEGLISALTSTVFIILIGYFLRKKDILPEVTGTVLSQVLLKVALPALVIRAFMSDISQEQLTTGIGVVIFGFIIYIALIFIAPLLYSRYEGDKRITLSIITIFGSTQFFGMPIVESIYGAEGLIYANLFNIAYRVFLYSYAYIVMSGEKFERKDLGKNLKSIFSNVIIITTIIGFLIWTLQPILPQVTVDGSQYAFLRIDQTAPWLFEPIDYLANLASPLAWLTIGTQLAKLDIKDAFSNKDAWFYAVNKQLIVPLITMIGVVILGATNILSITPIAFSVMVVLMASPTSNTAATYALSFDRESYLASNATFLSSILSILVIPLWVVITEVVLAIL